MDTYRVNECGRAQDGDRKTGSHRRSERRRVHRLERSTPTTRSASTGRWCTATSATIARGR
jgi:hypothetical protein